MSIPILIVIPARGGPRGISRKNLRAVDGQPLPSYSIRTVLASRHAADVVVSSEDEEIRMLAEPAIDTLISVVDDRHLCWEETDSCLLPAYAD